MTTASHPTTTIGVPDDGSEAAEVADFRATQRARYERFHESIDRSAAGGFVTFMNLGYEPLAGEPDVSDRWVSVFGRRVRRAEQRLVAELIGDGALVGPALDVGCGRGGTLQLLNRVAPDVSVVGVDLSPGALGRVQGLRGGCRRLPTGYSPPCGSTALVAGGVVDCGAFRPVRSTTSTPGVGDRRVAARAHGVIVAASAPRSERVT